MERLKHMKEALVSCIQTQMGDLRSVDTEELGDAIDMIKDLEEAMYYCTITKAMEDKEKEEKKGGAEHHHYYTPMPWIEPDYRWDRDMDKEYGRMYYTPPRDSMGRFTEDNRGGRRGYDGNGGSNGGNNGGNSGNGSNGGGSRYYTEREFPTEWRDTREGRSPMSRKTYMESKEMHKDKAAKIKELENYMKELSEDMVEMIQDASPEEKQVLEKKITALASKVASLNNA